MKNHFFLRIESRLWPAEYASTSQYLRLSASSRRRHLAATSLALLVTKRRALSARNSSAMSRVKIPYKLSKNVAMDNADGTVTGKIKLVSHSRVALGYIYRSR